MKLCLCVDPLFPTSVLYINFHFIPFFCFRMTALKISWLFMFYMVGSLPYKLFHQPFSFLFTTKNKHRLQITNRYTSFHTSAIPQHDTVTNTSLGRLELQSKPQYIEATSYASNVFQGVKMRLILNFKCFQITYRQFFYFMCLPVFFKFLIPNVLQVIYGKNQFFMSN